MIKKKQKMHKMFFLKIIQFLLFSGSNFSSEKQKNLKQKENFMDEGNYLKYLQEQKIFNKSLFI